MATISHPGVVDGVRLRRRPGGRHVPRDEVHRGRVLAHALDRAGRLSAAATMRLVAEAAEALHAAHEKGVTHRDIKPGNLLLRPDGSACVTDFGIARSAAATGTPRPDAVGTAWYIAPERAVGDPAHAQSDIYALGVVAYRCLAGRLPFAGESIFKARCGTSTMSAAAALRRCRPASGRWWSGRWRRTRRCAGPPALLSPSAARQDCPGARHRTHSGDGADPASKAGGAGPWPVAPPPWQGAVVAAGSSPWSWRPSRRRPKSSTAPATRNPSRGRDPGVGTRAPRRGAPPDRQRRSPPPPGCRWPPSPRCRPAPPAPRTSATAAPSPRRGRQPEGDPGQRQESLKCKETSSSESGFTVIDGSRRECRRRHDDVDWAGLDPRHPCFKVRADNVLPAVFGISRPRNTTGSVPSVWLVPARRPGQPDGDGGQRQRDPPAVDRQLGRRERLHRHQRCHVPERAPT